MKTLVEVEVKKTMYVLVESEDCTDVHDIDTAVLRACKNGVLFTPAFSKAGYISYISNTISSDVSEREKVNFDKLASSLVDFRNRFTLNELMEE